MIDHSKIAILSTVVNFELYAQTALLFPDHLQRYVIDGTNGMYGLQSIFYMMKKLRGKGIEWLVMADEDVLFQNPALVFEIIKKMKDQNYTVCGIRDGGILKHRNYNPYLINTFFSVLNFKEIELIWNKKEIRANNYSIKNEFDDDLNDLKEPFDAQSLYEPYYAFYLWLRRQNKQFLFLESNHFFQNDAITNTVYFQNNILLHHTWYARGYGKIEKHTQRIDAVLATLNFENKKTMKPIVFKDKGYYLKTKIQKFCKRIKMRLKL